jgi:GntR family transcriptional regulator
MRAQSAQRAGVMSQPLYAQVRDRLLERILGNEWQHGQLLPNEFELGRQFGVSIGTIRKAVEGLETAKIVVRKQGRGTFVSRDVHAPMVEPVSSFARMAEGSGPATISTLAISVRTGDVAELNALAVSGGEQVIRIDRRRRFADGACVLDRICLPHRLFFDLDVADPLPANLYEFYGDFFGIRVVKSTEDLSVEMADETVAKAMQLNQPTPVIKIARTAVGSSGDVVEWRVSYCVLPKGLSMSGML